jgi:hypothetical protein
MAAMSVTARPEMKAESESKTQRRKYRTKRKAKAQKSTGWLMYGVIGVNWWRLGRPEVKQYQPINAESGPFRRSYVAYRNMAMALAAKYRRQ